MAYEFESHRPHTFLRHPICGSSSVGRAPPCQGGGRESEPRLPLHFLRGCSSMAELQPSKLATRVRFPSPAPSAIHRARGFAVVAQLVERHLAKVEVASPSLVYRSIRVVVGRLFFHITLHFPGDTPCPTEKSGRLLALCPGFCGENAVRSHPKGGHDHGSSQNRQLPQGAAQ